MIERYFVKYTAPPRTGEGGCLNDLQDELSEWKERMKYFHEDFNWLLGLSNEAFWEQIVCDETFNLSLDSFLQFCPRYFDEELFPPQCKQIQNTLKKLVLLTIIRISSFSETRCMLLYDNYLLDIPKVLDICAIYGGVTKETKVLISNALNNIFSLESRYWDDFEAAIQSFSQSLDRISEKLGLDSAEDDSPQELQNANGETISAGECEDILQYLHDSAYTFASFVSFLDVPVQIFLQNEFIPRLALVIDSFLPALQAAMGASAAKEKKLVFNRITKCIALFSNLVLLSCFSKANAESGQKNMRRNECEKYLNTVASLLPYTRFLRCYEKYHGVENDLNSRADRKSFENEETFVYIKSVLSSLADVPKPRRAESREGFNNAEEQGAVGCLGEDEIASAIEQIQSLFPDEDEAFLRAFVVHRNGSAETVINDIIEDNIPPFLREIKGESNQRTNTSNHNGVSEARSSWQQDNLPGQFYIKQDKVSRTEQFQVLNDKSHSKYALQYVEKSDKNQPLNWIGDEAEEFSYDAYDDEYDDTYDSQNIGAMDADSRDELKDLTNRRSLVKPRVLEALDKHASASGSSESESETEETAETANQSGFYAPRGGMRRTYQGNRGRGRGGSDNPPRRGRGGAHRGSNRGSSDKSAHRGGMATRAKKHNRKTMAAKKNSRGMGPI